MKIIDIDLTFRKVTVKDEPKLDRLLGGVALATELFTKNCPPNIDPLSPDNIIVFANGPLTAAFPTASKTAALFKSPLNNELGESYAGGRMASAMRFAGYDAIIIRGKATHPVYIAIHDNSIKIKNAELLWNLRSVFVVGRILRDAEPQGPGRRSFIRTGRAGDRLIKYANLNVDNYRHFGRLGLGAVFGSKNLKAMVLEGTTDFVYPDMKAYKAAYREVYDYLKETDDMDKYHILGTASGIKSINAMGALPTRNFSSGQFEFIDNITGEYFADNLLLRKISCSQCPVGCIHIAYLRVPYKKEEYDVETTFVPYDYELIYALGSNLGIETASDVLRLIEIADSNGFDIISLGGILAWATDAYTEGLITSTDTMGVNFEFGNTINYLTAIDLIIRRENDFYQTLGDGIDACVEKFGGEDFAIRIGGQTPAGYMTGPGSIIGHMIGQRHSHLCNAGYSYDQKNFGLENSAKDMVDALIKEEKWRQILNSLAICLFARKVYNVKRTLESLNSIGINMSEDNLNTLADETYKKKNDWKIAAGQKLSVNKLAERLFQFKTPRGYLNIDYLQEAIAYYSSLTGLPVE
ncbi:MAG TPA: aldehyde ferredoxin oxidoreductase N-terminal domain-containing protein [Candidatus Bathyarchaeia archaeon]|nr:aldehyde ferredoxin oxidoreductase N-terminal domain-containing protein [Candidatus Bathyarchaeia archaeon]